MNGPRSYVRVALPLPLDQTFTYAVEGGPLRSGTRVLVPFQRQERIGFVVGQGGEEGVKRIRTVLSVMDAEPSVSESQMRLARWMADYYVTSLGIALKTMLPSVLSDTSRDVVTLHDGPRGKLLPREARLVEALDSGTRQSARALKRSLRMGSIWPELRKLAAAGVVSVETLPPQKPPVKTERVVRVTRWIDDIEELNGLVGRARRQADAYRALAGSGGTVELAHLTRQAGFSRGVIHGLEEKGLAVVEDREVERDPFAHIPAGEDQTPTPTDRQEEVIRTLASAFDAGPKEPFLLHGVTGSGKTLVYIEVLSHVLSQGRGAIVLVPEISLTPQTVARFRARFGDQVAVLHSALSAGERFDAWRQLRSGRRRIAVGARSALFAPVSDLGLVVVDEEHDGSYKQSEAPRYQARDMAVVRSAQEGALCVLGSATPALESWHNVERGKFRLVSLPDRVGGGVLPPVRLIDLREARKKSKEKTDARSEAGLVLTAPLVGAMSDRLDRGEQTILLLNRRGYSAFVQCRECGDVGICPACSISLTYHRGKGRLVCHHCRHEERAPKRCPRCGSTDLSFRGLGTEQVERVVAETFPDARLARMDVDTTSGKWSHHEILGRVERREVDILLGTQMIAKGLDFPGVTLVGVVNADVGIHLPDFRATERTFQLLSQVAGRAGRGKLGGDVLIQTALPEHYAIQAALEHDYVAFATRELKERRNPAYPPMVRLVNVVVSSPAPKDAAGNAEAAARWLRMHVVPGTLVDLIGPAPSPIERLHGRWRWHFLLRSVSAKAVGASARRLQAEFRARGTDVRIAIDRDPSALL
ncbi:MAG TPA: primosomal protein N' [Gemmatimonadetes bacterium]|nr:primosomal protein N' [Gemmatimonadota bacterium]